MERDTQVTIVPYAVSDKTGEQVFFEDSADFAMGTLSPKWEAQKAKTNIAKRKQTTVATITIDQLIEEYGVPDYVKIDVEGSEWQVIKGLSQPVRLLSFEAILPLFWEETMACLNRLSGLSSTALFNYSVNDVMIFPIFTDRETLLQHLSSEKQTIDIFCQMIDNQ